jgi:hypothetical protein
MQLVMLFLEVLMAFVWGIVYANASARKTGMCTRVCHGYKMVVPCFAMPENECPSSSFTPKEDKKN